MKIRHPGESRDPGLKLFFERRLKAWIPAFAGMTALLLSNTALSSAEWLSIDGKPAKWNDIIEVRLRDIHPTQPCLGFDRIYYKLGRYQHDRRKMFDDYCRKNGQKGVKDFSYASSDLHDPKTFSCLEPVGQELNVVKTVVIAPDGNIYLTNGHHTYNAYWHMKDGGPDLHVFVRVARDYRDLSSMDDFWQQMIAEKNIWLHDANDQKLTVADLPKSLGLENFQNDNFRSLLYFTKLFSWRSPESMSVPDPKFFGDDFPEVPFLEFYWGREVRKTVDLEKFNLNSQSGYVDAVEAVGETMKNLHLTDVGGSGKTSEEMGQFQDLNEWKIFKINRPATGKLAYMLEFKKSKFARALDQSQKQRNQPFTKN